MNTQSIINVWDLWVRLFHWSLVIFFFTAYLTEDEFQNIHIYAGYGVSILIVFRMLWGLIGPKHARFSSFIKGPSETLAYLKGLITGHPVHYIGHNPAGGWMVLLLLIMLALTTLAGISLLAIDGEGPLAGTFIAHFNSDWLEGVHEFAANSTLCLVAIHVGGVLVSSLLHRGNLVRAMFTGRKLLPPSSIGDSK